MGSVEAWPGSLLYPRTRPANFIARSAVWCHLEGTGAGAVGWCSTLCGRDEPGIARGPMLEGGPFPDGTRIGPLILGLWCAVLPVAADTLACEIATPVGRDVVVRLDNVDFVAVLHLACLAS